MTAARCAYCAHTFHERRCAGCPCGSSVATRRAALAVAWNLRAQPVAVTSGLLDILGLLTDGGIAAEDTASYDDVNGTGFGVGDNNLDLPAEIRQRPSGLELLADRSTLPPGLRDRVPAQTTPKSSKRSRPAPATLPPVRDVPPARPVRKKTASPPAGAEPAVKWRAGRPRANTPVCGTPQGYDRHQRLRKADPTHRACQPCLDAAAKRQRDYEAARRARLAALAPATPRRPTATPKPPDHKPATPLPPPPTAPAPVTHLPAPRPIPEHAALLQGTGDLHRWARAAGQSTSLAVRGAGRRLDEALAELYAAVTHLTRTEQVAGVSTATGARHD